MSACRVAAPLVFPPVAPLSMSAAPRPPEPPRPDLWQLLMLLTLLATSLLTVAVHPHGAGTAELRLPSKLPSQIRSQIPSGAGAGASPSPGRGAEVNRERSAPPARSGL
ncbi:hypothetical protein GCM10025734_56610 [Kitasatospora paranensis]